ncbi:MAG TPA: peptidoglycan editing factor PgeF [Terriglobia bacterium]|nr:peptidoglycan editing factor PgeF [Terriglobia bacterium]
MTVSFNLTSSQGLEWIECSLFSRLPWLLHAVSTRRGGVSPPPAEGLNLGYTPGDERYRVDENRRRFLHAIGARGFTLATLQQVHSTAVHQVIREPSGALECVPTGLQMALGGNGPGDSLTLTPGPRSVTPECGPAGDALMTAESGVLLSVRVADCLPILLVDPRQRVVAAVHAGWRGALGRIAQKTAAEMQRIFGSRPSEILAAVGPGIGACCYEVGGEVAQRFRGAFAGGDAFFCEREQAAASARNNLLQLDLTAVVRRQLLDGDLDPDNIHATDFCTACRTDLFFSHRKEGPTTGRMMAVAGMRP